MKGARQRQSTTRSSAGKVARNRGQESGWVTLRSGLLQILQVRALARLPWVVHGFSTRCGGTSHLDDSPRGKKALNLSFTEWDKRSDIAANRAKFAAALDAEPMHLVTLRQIHSDVVHTMDAPPRSAPRGDAAITRASGLLLAVQTADCIPILLVDTKQRAVGVVHAGWRGTLRRVAAKAVGRMQMAWGTEPSDVLAVLGPAIGRCCYEVGPEVAQAYAGQFAQAREWFDGPFDQLATGEEPNPLKWLTMMPPGHDPPPARVKLDLIAANRWQLLEAGVQPANVIASELCTSCRADLFFSYRRDGAHTGRMMAAVGKRAGFVHSC